MVTPRVSPFIRISHDFCEIDNVYLQESFNQIIVDNGGTNCRIRDINMVWRTYAFTAGSSGILVKAAGCNISGVYSNYSSGGGPAALIAVGTGASGNVSAPYIDNVVYICASTGVLIHGDSNSISRGRITNVNYRGAVGNAPQAVKFLTSGTGNVFGFTVDGITVASTATADITLEQNSSGEMKDISIDGVYSSGASGNGIEFIRTAGALHDITIGACVDVSGRTNDITTTGTVTGITVAIPGRRKGKTASFTVPASGADDGVAYHVQSAGATTITLPDTAAEGLSFTIAGSGGGAPTLSASGSATINGGATKALTANQLYTVVCTRNSGGSAAQWMTRA